MKKILVLLIIAVLTIPAVTSAAPYRQGPYLSGFIGVTVPADTDSTGFNLNDRIEFDPGLNIGGAFGFDFGVVRLEAELSYKQAEISSVNDKLTGESYRSIDGDVEATALMGNIFIDFDNPGPITPYLGGGVGFATLHQSDVFGTSSSTGSRVVLYDSDDDAVLAYQAGAGIEIALNRQLSLDLAYRYFHTTRATFANSTFDNEFEFESHNATVGLRLKY